MKLPPSHAVRVIMEWAAVLKNPALVSVLSEKFPAPTDIQTACLQHATEFRQDLVLAARTGSGKTLCFGIPIIDRIEPCQELKALILTPTRELALQVKEHLKQVNYRNLGIQCLIGGMAEQKQERLLKRKPEVVIATPGRLWYFIEEQHPHIMKVYNCELLVIDEADRMIEAGHFKELKMILNYIYNPVIKPKQVTESDAPIQDLNFGYDLELDEEAFEVDGSNKDLLKAQTADIMVGAYKPKVTAKRQTILTSATLTLTEEGRLTQAQKIKMKHKGQKESRIDAIMSAVKFIKPRIIDLTSEFKLPSGLTEQKIRCEDSEKDGFLSYFLKEHEGEPTIVFVNSIPCARRVVAVLVALEIDAVRLDGKMQQRQRLKKLEKFNKGSWVLVCTDVAGRGLDLPQVRNVVHYQLPRTTEIYIHRCGRTARAGREGFSLSLIGPQDVGTLKKIQYLVNRELDNYAVVYKRYMKAVREVKLASELANIVYRDEKARKQDSWTVKSANEAGVEADVGQVVNKRRKIRALSSDLNSIKRTNEVISRTSVITPELFAMAKARNLV
mmetsp:Transcript_13306/g.24995  ORF Transcript_13306/g.24995 Transcript_13306/m.24995 type:complete len:557 (-) Transcript_13306:533-2203(-)|eukprot:CAMPEP_0204901874 /NCGR_PEP_ID=MMETSP1397-20131031/3338_1 /ASSEMBLY_ACC=CAM_ASM_000891 /TAXON_ID=49980 /ORGANISM="Climacostomum Climacostomum virens, Strain Stock W-24" /LENGTH=556 /DNA_ID=CAMNT_0052070297 /DNA_START=1101 /DNA_END=2771 /DNA_ORIENTATION=+